MIVVVEQEHGTQTITGAGTPAAPITNLASFTFKAPEVNEDKTYKVKFSSTIMEDVKFSAVPNSSATATITVKAKETSNSDSGNNGSSSSTGSTSTEKPVEKPTETISNDATLKNLGIKPNDFSGFKKSKTSYDVTVPNSVSSVSVYAVANNSNA